MKRIQPILLLMAAMCLGQYNTSAQAPVLPTKSTLANTLFSAKTYSSSSATDTSLRFRSLPSEFTLQVVAKVTSAAGRGLDIDARNAQLKGFRLSLDAANLKWTAPLASAQNLSTSNAGEFHTIRIAVKRDSAHIYQNGAYLLSKPLAAIKDIIAGVETDSVLNATIGSDLIPDWDGTAASTSGAPSSYGWAYTDATTTTLFNTANGGSGSRYMDVNASSGGNVHTLNGSTYTGRLLYIRWDGGAYQNAVYSYPVTLAANTTYNFSMLHAYISNATGSKTITVGIGKTTAGSARYATKTFVTDGTRALKRESFQFTSQEAGQYYLTFTGNWALFSIAELTVKQFTANSRFIFGKNYPSGAVNMEISSATYEDGAFAPTTLVTGTRQTVNLTGSAQYLIPAFNTDYVVAGKTDVHFTGEGSPFVNSTITLNSNDSWLFFDNVKPSLITANWLSSVKINGAAAVVNSNVRLSPYKNGTVVIPNGNQTSLAALQVYSQQNLSGTSATYPIEVYNSLGALDNKIRSFKLKRGYMATFGNNPDGTGYSRVFIASDSDLVVNTMPQGLDTTVSFVRVLKWNWVSKKGKAGGGTPVNLTNSTWYYDWNIGGSTAADYEYAAIRQTQYWPGWGDINSKSNISHLLGFNEPDRPDQANMSVETAIAQWPELMKSGLRVGSPAPSNPPAWLDKFMAKADSLNYRVDYVAIHCYWGGITPQTWYNRLKAIYDQFKRPIWITEWNNGANWTTETWPTEQNAQFQKQLEDLKGILNVLDTASFVERYAIYDWVENKRALVLADTLTPAGKYYAASKSDFAFNRSKEYIHAWKLTAPTIFSSIKSTDYFKTTISWTDINGELGSKYILERKIDGRDADFVLLQQYTGYAAAAVMTFEDSVFAKATYRLKAFGTNGVTFVYSGTHEILRDVAPVAPTVTGDVVSATKLRINWTAVTSARSYNLKRSLSASGPFTTIAARTNALTFLDEGLQPATNYYYVVTTLNSAGESANSTVLLKATPALVVPAGATNPRIASGDAKITLSWDFMYDAKYKILRSSSAGGTYDTLVNNLDAVRYEDRTRANGSTWYYKIIAYNNAGSSPASAAFTGAPVAGRYLRMNFNEGAGTLAKDNWGGYNGTLANAAVWTTGKDVGSGAVNLVKASGSYIQLESGAMSELEDFTIATWFKMPANQGYNTRLFDFGNSTSVFMMLTPRVSTANGPSLRYKITCPAGTNDRYMAYDLPLDQWVHLAISQQGSIFKMYVNGTLQYTDSSATVTPSDMGITVNNYLGRSQYSTDPYSDHTYDDLVIYNYALSAAQVDDLYDGNMLNLLAAAPYIAPVEASPKAKVYPNPVSSRLNIELPVDAAADLLVQLYNLAGQQVLEEKKTANGSRLQYVDVSNLPAGVYQLRVINAGKVYNARVLKQ
ncbi:glycosyl hydrolase [uncultured Chitinophaga sp.]|uniref:glycosyl hydrolase n=1 Tax=uncultured Chitinophaga sp. TaxID=339340 RepID=UPI0025E64B55|nr:glycosyl hydrolase [uncultured Chitinophaga sp.]